MVGRRVKRSAVVIASYMRVANKCNAQFTRLLLLILLFWSLLLLLALLCTNASVIVIIIVVGGCGCVYTYKYAFYCCCFCLLFVRALRLQRCKFALHQKLGQRVYREWEICMQLGGQAGITAFARHISNMYLLTCICMYVAYALGGQWVDVDSCNDTATCSCARYTLTLRNINMRIPTQVHMYVWMCICLSAC